MGNLEERQEEHQGGVGSQGLNNTVSDGRQEANPSPSMGRHNLHSQNYTFGRDLWFNMLLIYTFCLFESAGKQKQGKANSRKSKSPNLGQAYAGGERPSSVSSVHSEGDYHRQAQAQPQWSWDDRPSSTGELSSLCC